jgi:hypothetical protein
MLKGHTNALVLTLQGFVEAAYNRHENAVESFRRAIIEDPSFSEGWLGLGLMYCSASSSGRGGAQLSRGSRCTRTRALTPSELPGQGLPHRWR